METKLCKACDTIKPVSDFYYQRGKPSHPCKECKKASIKEARTPEKIREDNLKKFGITQRDYELMFSEQDCGCAICGGTTMPGDKKYLAVDHCHSTGEVRGLLCNSCNLLLGHAKDSVETLQNAIDYLRKHEQ